MCLTFHVRVCTLLWNTKKGKYLHEISMFAFTIFTPCLPNLGDQIRCAQNRYAAVQTDIKYPLTSLVNYSEMLLKARNPLIRNFLK